MATMNNKHMLTSKYYLHTSFPDFQKVTFFMESDSGKVKREQRELTTVRRLGMIDEINPNRVGERQIVARRVSVRNSAHRKPKISKFIHRKPGTLQSHESQQSATTFCASDCNLVTIFYIPSSSHMQPTTVYFFNR